MKSDERHAGIVPRGPRPGFHDSMAHLSIRGARAAFVGPALDLSPHRNAVAVVAIALKDAFDLACFGPGVTKRRYVSRDCALIAPGQLHHLRAHGPIGFVYLDALGDDHAAIQNCDLERATVAFRRALRRAWSVDDLCQCLGLPRKPPPDPRIAALLAELDRRPNDFRRLAVAARFVGVSPSRCRDLIRLSAGVSFRRYRRWRRFAIVMRQLSLSRTLTEAAHYAGFASSAHLSAAFRAAFGLAPSTLIKLGVSVDHGENVGS